ncbi:MAG: UvrD-helicase domain-containing protein, partial [Oscillospiraceae bacterium]|nr:UvrD-helicase domain-containing protein [Oscillospiraceae bacterium]
ADENESRPLLAEALEDVIEDRYARLDEFPGFAELADTVSEGRRDTALIETVLTVHEKLLSHAAPVAWAEEQVAKLDMSGLEDASQTPWGAHLLGEAHATARYWLREMTAARESFADDALFAAAYGPSWDETLDGLARFVAGAAQSWDAAHAAATIPFPRAKSAPGAEYDELKALRDRSKKAMEKLAELFDLPSAALFEDMEAVRPVVTALLSLVLDVERAYQKEKTRRGILDFSDLEHLAIRLLIDDTGKPTAAARELAGRYREIMVDEFQDVSGLQDEIFRALGAEGSRRFMVGDVKQSIYRFRLADPTIFLSYYRNFPDLDRAAPGEPRKVLLGQNFRSRPGVLDAVNFLFRQIMSESFGEMDYGDREALYPGLDRSADDSPAVELDILNRHPLEKDGTDARDMAEARHVAARIRKLHDEEGHSWSDFAILLRSLKGKAYRFEKALEEQNIPVAKSGGEGFFYTPEVASILSLLTVTLNPLQDVPLIGALRSPLYGFSPDDLADIRLRDREVSFFEAMELSAAENEKCKAFLTDLARWRDTAADMTVDQFVWVLVHETNALAVFSALPQGEARRQNLLTFLAYARSAVQSGCKSLFDFVTQLEKRLEAGEPPKLTAPHSAGDAVTIMSVHKSKGLEFPVVLLPDLGKRFGFHDLKEQILVHPALGFGSVRRDLTRKIRYPTLAHMALKQTLRRELLAEELRILYVAMTRAQQKLILTAALDNAEKTRTDLALMATDPVSPYVLNAQSSMAPWLLLPTLATPDPPWVVQWIDCGETDEPEPNEERLGRDMEDSPPDKEVEDTSPADKVPEVPFIYPHAAAIDLPSKLTATELKRRGEYPESKRPILFQRPGFIDADRPLTPAQRGTATHLVMQFIDFQACTSLQGVRSEIERLQREGRITAQSAQAVDAPKIWSFFKSALGQRVLTAERLRREFKFSLLVSAEAFLGTGGDEQILLQGVVDCYLEEADGLVVLDFKTDYVPPGGLAAKAAEYEPQMRAYAYALEQIIGKPVKELILYFFSSGESANIL